MMQLDTTDMRWTMDSAGDWLCIKTPKARNVLSEVDPEKTYDVTIKEHRERRSLDANAYCWVLIDRLAEKLGIPKTEIYRGYIREIGGNSETVCVIANAADKLRAGWEHNGIGWQADVLPSKIAGCVNLTLYYGSSTYDTRQMARLIDMAVQDCKAQGIETLPPYKLASMLEVWDA